MSILVDSSVFIAEERTRIDALGAIQRIKSRNGGHRIALSTISVMELAHGVPRSNSEERARLRMEFIQELIRTLPVFETTNALAMRVGRLDGELAKLGIRVPMTDLIIGITALEYQFDVLTKNVRHFKMIPNLIVHEYD